MRHGYGIRKSAPYGVAAKYRSRSHAHASLTSLRSDQSEEGNDKDGKSTINLHNLSSSQSFFYSITVQSSLVPETRLYQIKIVFDSITNLAEVDDSRGGFVLRARSEPPSRRRSLSERSVAVKRTILQGLRIKKQRSTGDIDQRVNSGGTGEPHSKFSPARLTASINLQYTFS